MLFATVFPPFGLLKRLRHFRRKSYRVILTQQPEDSTYFAGILSQDEEIKEILSLCGAERQVNSFDRDFYRNWKENWKFPVEVIKEAASHAAGKAQPMKYINGVLANWNEQGVKTLEKAKELIFSMK